MKILIDLQGAQTSGSSHRGIGRYSLSLTKEMANIAPARGHSVHILLNASFPDTAIRLRAELRGSVDPQSIHLWYPPVGAIEAIAEADYIRAAGMIRASVIDQISPDVVLVTSLFEGYGDEAVATCNEILDGPMCAVVLYDLIPFIYASTYLADPSAAKFYYGRVRELRRADLLLAISDSARAEGIDYLNLAEADVVSISTAADTVFKPAIVPIAQLKELCRRYGLRQKFIMYTGGIDSRKNIEVLIRAFSRLPYDVRQSYTLAIVCAATEGERSLLQEVGQAHSLGDDDLCITGFVPEEDLIAFYRTCSLFVFPSLHEGFGLPALEAMACGAPVIGSNRSSIPEVIGWDEALFDPANERAMTGKILEALTQPGFQAALQQRSAAQAAKFSWRRTADTALDALGAKFELRRGLSKPPAPYQNYRPRLAFVSPVPPQKTGIAQYAADLVPELGRYYDIDMVHLGGGNHNLEIQAAGVLDPEEFSRVGYKYDHVVYQMGNSEFHTHMPELMAKFPGTVVLHDPYLGGMSFVKDAIAGQPGYWTGLLRDEAGYVASLRHIRVKYPTEIEPLQNDFISNLDVVRYSTNIVVHSKFAESILIEKYGQSVVGRTHVVPLPRRDRPPLDRDVTRKKLGIAKDDFVVCSFGGVHPTKMHDALLDGWFGSTLAQDKSCRLVIVGGIGGGSFGKEIEQMIAAGEGGERVSVLGYVTDNMYGQYLVAADAGIQLRKDARGETSAAVMDCLLAGIPLIISTTGSFKEVPGDLAFRLPAAFGPQDVSAALETLFADPSGRARMAVAARAHMKKNASTRVVAERLRGIIEARPVGSVHVREELLKRVRKSLAPEILAQRAVNLADAIARSLPLPRMMPRLLIDVSGLDREKSVLEETKADGIVEHLLRHEIDGYRTEPFILQESKTVLASDYAYAVLGQAETKQTNNTFDVQSGDICLSFFVASEEASGHLEAYRQFRVAGVRIVVVCTDTMLLMAEQRRIGLTAMLARVATFADVILLNDRSSISRLINLLDENYASRPDPVRLVAMSSQTGKSESKNDRTIQEIGLLESLLRGRSEDRHLPVQVEWIPRRKFIVRGDNPLLQVGPGSRAGRQVQTIGQEGHMLFGPYLPVLPGTYEVRVFMKVSKPAGAYIDVCINGSSSTLAQAALQMHDRLSSPIVTFRVEVPPRSKDLEVRLYVNQETDLLFSHYAIEMVDALKTQKADPLQLTLQA